MQTTVVGDSKKCAECGKFKLLTEFKKRSSLSNFYRPYCIPCFRTRQNAWRKRRYEKSSKLARKWSFIHHRQYKESAINIYSNGEACCAWCKQADIDVLCLDHVNNDGAEHRRKIGSGSSNLYKWVRRYDYPPIFQVLCYNCNWKKLALIREKRYRELIGGLTSQ